MLITDAAGKIEWVNPAFHRLTGYTAEEVIGKTPRVLKSGINDTTCYEALWKTVLAGDVWHGELVNRRKDGTHYEEEMTITPIKDREGRITHFVGIHRDVTHRRRAERALSESEERYRRLSEDLERRVEHRTAELQRAIGDLDTSPTASCTTCGLPCAPCQGSHRSSSRNVANASTPCAEIFSTASRSPRIRMDKLILDALDYSKAVRGELPMEAVDADSLVRGTPATYPDLQPPGAHVTLRGPLPRVRANVAGLTQCMSNLLRNAVKFVRVGETPEVCIWAEPRPGERVRIWVEDKGIGSSARFAGADLRDVPATQQRIRGDRHRAGPRPEGRRAHGGSVGVESEPGEGSRFWLELTSAAPTLDGGVG